MLLFENSIIYFVIVFVVYFLEQKLVIQGDSDENSGHMYMFKQKLIKNTCHLASLSVFFSVNKNMLCFYTKDLNRVQILFISL